MIGQGVSPALSRREREVAALVTEGLTDRQIAKRLFISERTVEGHVQQIRNKLTLANRAQIASWMTRERMRGDDSVVTPMDAAPNNLPIQLTTFVNRTHELAELRRLLQRTRLVTITGPGGCGKTRLAVETAGQVLHRYPDGAWFIDLASVRDSTLVPRVFAEALGLHDLSTDDRSGGRQQALVVLDNCEHMIAECAATVHAVLRGSRRVSVVCTSRQPLHVEGEATWSLGPLSTPAPGADDPPELLGDVDSVRLFVDRATLADPEFVLDRSNAAQVAQICLRLDGLPLAIELAAAHVGVMPIGELAQRLEERLDAPLSRTASPRQRTLTAALDWSYGLLDDAERRLFACLSVFSGGFTLEAAEFVCGDGDQPVVDVLARLINRSLVLRVRSTERRYRWLDIIRRYALAHLAASGELEALQARHKEFFVDVARAASVRLTGPEQPLWLSRLEDDHANLRAALEYSQMSDPTTHMQLAMSLLQFWNVRGHLGEGRAWLEGALRSQASVPEALRASASNAAGRLAVYQGDVIQAANWLAASLEIEERLGNHVGVVACLTNLGIVACLVGDLESGRTHFERGLVLARTIGSQRPIGLLLDNLGVLAGYLDDHETAHDRLTEALGVWREIGDPARIANALANLGMLAVYGGQRADATLRYAESLHVLEAIDAPQTTAECLEGFAWIAARDGRAERAMRLAAAAADIRSTIGAPAPPWCQRVIDECLTMARKGLSPAAAAKAWKEGEGLSMRDAVALALS